MATITNHSEFHLSIVGKIDDRGYKHDLMAHRMPSDGSPPGKPPAIDVPDADAKDWASRGTMVASGKVGIAYGVPGTLEDLDKLDSAPARPHWRTAIATAKGTEDLDELEAMHETEDRPKVRAAIETRMQELIA